MGVPGRSPNIHSGTPFPSKKRERPMFPVGKPAGRWRATTGLQFNKRMHPGRACQQRSLPLAPLPGCIACGDGSRWWRFSATHRLPALFPPGTECIRPGCKSHGVPLRERHKHATASHRGTKRASLPPINSAPGSLQKSASGHVPKGNTGGSRSVARHHRFAIHSAHAPRRACQRRESPKRYAERYFSRLLRGLHPAQFSNQDLGQIRTRLRPQLHGTGLRPVRQRAASASNPEH